MIYTDTTITSTGLPIPQTDPKITNSSTWLDYFYNKDVPYVHILKDQWTPHDDIICKDYDHYMLFNADLKCIHGIYFLDTNDTVIAFINDDNNSWIRLSLLPEARKDGSNDEWINNLLLAKMMLPTSIWMLMCITGYDYDTLEKEVLKNEVEY